MKLYRYINISELDDIKKYNRLIFRHPSCWGKNESILTRVFNFKNIGTKVATLKQIHKLIDIYIATSQYASISPPAPNEYVKWDDNISKMYYDLYTDILVMLQLSYYCYAKCWTTEINNWNDTQTSGAKTEEDRNCAYIVANVEIGSPQKTTLFDPKGNQYNGYYQIIPVQYADFGYNQAIETIISRFNENGRYLHRLLCTIQGKYSKQKEYRLIVTPDFYDLREIGSFSAYITSRYTKPQFIRPIVGSKDDLAEALFDASVIIKTYTDELFSVENDGQKLLYWELPPDFIKDIVMKC